MVNICVCASAAILATRFFIGIRGAALAPLRVGRGSAFDFACHVGVVGGGATGTVPAYVVLFGETFS